MENVLTSAGWFQKSDSDEIDDDDDQDEHEHEHKHDNQKHDHHHEHHHEHGETEEYGIGTFVYYRRRPFNRQKFEEWANKDYGKKIIRAKGLVYFSDNMRMSYIYESAGSRFF